jgi:DNA invertase Pin-like site-specific DNA recombinase
MERRLISQRTREALQAAKSKGVKLGGTTAKSIANREEALQRAEALRPIFDMSHRKMAAELNALGVPTPAGGQWHAVTVKRVLERLQETGASRRSLSAFNY